MKQNIKSYFYLLYFLGVAFFLISCVEDKRPKRDCPIEELLLSQSDYPPETIFNNINSPVAEMPLESASISTNYNSNATFQEVARHFATKNAISEFEKVEKIVFNSNKVVGSWEIPSKLELIDLSADIYKIACGNVVSFGNRCYMVGQYEEYYVFFRADISSQGIDHELFRDLVLKIDEEMSSCIDN